MGNQAKIMRCVLWAAVLLISATFVFNSVSSVQTDGILPCSHICYRTAMCTSFNYFKLNSTCDMKHPVSQVTLKNSPTNVAGCLFFYQVGILIEFSCRILLDSLIISHFNKSSSIKSNNECRCAKDTTTTGIRVSSTLCCPGRQRGTTHVQHVWQRSRLCRWSSPNPNSSTSLSNLIIVSLSEHKILLIINLVINCVFTIKIIILK